MCTFIGYFQWHNSSLSKSSRHKAFIWRFLSRLCQDLDCFKRDFTLPGQNEKRTGFIETQYKEKIVCLPPCASPVPILISSCFPCKQFLSKDWITSHKHKTSLSCSKVTNFQDSTNLYLTNALLWILLRNFQTCCSIIRFVYLDHDTRCWSLQRFLVKGFHMK